MSLILPFTAFTEMGLKLFGGLLHHKQPPRWNPLRRKIGEGDAGQRSFFPGLSVDWTASTRSTGSPTIRLINSVSSPYACSPFPIDMETHRRAG